MKLKNSSVKVCLVKSKTSYSLIFLEFWRFSFKSISILTNTLRKYNTFNKIWKKTYNFGFYNRSWQKLHYRFCLVHVSNNFFKFKYENYYRFIVFNLPKNFIWFFYFYSLNFYYNKIESLFKQIFLFQTINLLN